MSMKLILEIVSLLIGIISKESTKWDQTTSPLNMDNFNEYQYNMSPMDSNRKVIYTNMPT